MNEARSALLPVALAIVGLGVAVGIYVAQTAPTRSSSLVMGEPAPGFELPRLGGEPLSLESMRGKVVYVNLWATWCGPCREEAPSLQKLYAELHDEGFEILAATIDAPSDLSKVEAFRKEFGLSYPILLDAEKTVYHRYGATAVPESYLVDAQGRLVEAYIGPRDFSDPRYGRLIRQLLEERGDVDAGEGA